MKIEKTKCDWCGKEYADYYAEKELIHISTSSGLAAVNINITDGRRDDGCAKSKCFKTFNDAHFCNIDCLVNFILDAH